MNPLEAQLDYPFGDTIPPSGTLQAIAPGVQWLRMPLPFALDHINLWRLDDSVDGRSGWSVVDCGASTAPTLAAWEQLAGAAGPLRVVATHCHPDHVGMAAWLCRRGGAALWMTTGEYAFARMMAAALPGVDGTAAIPHFERHGLRDDALRAKMGERRSYYPSLVPDLPQAYTRMQDGQRIRIGAHDWEVITGFGHSPEHAALYCAGLNLLISGDMVLPRISTNVSVFAVEPEANPVQLYLDSLAKFDHVPHDVLVLPSHGRPFRGLHTRIRQLREHHAARLAEVIEACASPRSAAEIVPVMFRRPLDTHQLTFALGEALAHLHQLWYAGILKKVPGDDGVIRFALI